MADVPAVHIYDTPKAPIRGGQPQSAKTAAKKAAPAPAARCLTRERMIIGSESYRGRYARIGWNQNRPQ